MHSVRWSDNTCTVGYTSIHGYFNQTDREFLKSLVPNGEFIPTFYRDPRNQAVASREMPYYFHFRKKEGKALLVALQLMGVLSPGIRYIRQVHTRRRLHVRDQEYRR